MSEAARSENTGTPQQREEAQEQAQLLARAARAGAMRRTSATYAQSAATTRRSLLRNAALGGLAVAGAGSLAACGTAPAHKSVPATEATGHAGTDFSATEKVINFSNWPAYIDIDSNDKNKHPTLDQFKEQTGITVKYTEDINDNNEFYTTIDPMLAAGKDTGRDLIVMSDYMIPKLRENNYIQKLDLSNIPNHGNMTAQMANVPVDPGRKYTVPWASGFTVIAYNAKLISTPITSITELFTRPDLKGKVSLMAEMEDTIAFALFALGKDPAKFTDDDFNAAIAYIQKAKDAGQVRAYSGNDYLSDFTQGNTVVTMAYSGDVAALGVDYLKTVFPKEGSLSWYDNMCIPNYARHKANAEKLMNYYLQPKVAAELDDYIDYIPVVEGAVDALKTLDASAASNPLIVPTAQELATARQFMAISVAKLDEYTKKYLQVTG
ncbi:spermidine/putrescine ABC transporter substrate-binding protein [Actinocrinis puniceicyclus]|uniref:Spermidine/putrescine ABC transporter substrate-binding protein n=1 Tax=Actinocrinis puniceicyclus TaxID=977794 RepID=A0A8J7WN19_9ACTN|nr:spermidine/putrescine ABC transporter substrate-binding protein [Actinocrinis puniceicyclus]MBS2962849.1 spermidine/putrescine ABC transporter substrate-binding protein [Actinocrinis puniceicyclus]